MATFKSDKVLNEKYAPSAAPHSSKETYSVASKTTIPIADILVVGDLVHLAVLPANCVPCGFRALVNDLETVGTTLTFDVGILNTAGDGLVASSKLVSASDAGQAGGIAYMNDADCVWNTATWLAEALCPGYDADDNRASSSVEKVVALRVTHDGAGVPPADATIHARLRYRAIEEADKPV